MNNWKKVATCGERLREAMKEKGMRQIDLANKTGLNRSTINWYVNDRCMPKSNAINLMAIALDVSEMWLWGYDTDKQRVDLQAAAREKTEEIKFALFGGESATDEELEEVRQFVEFIKAKREKEKRK